MIKTLLIVTILLLNVETSNSQLVYLKLKPEFATKHGLRNINDFLKQFPEFSSIVTTYDVQSISCPFKAQSASVQSIYYVYLSNKSNLEAFVAAINQFECVDYAELPLKFSFSSTVNDFNFESEQWNLQIIQTEEAWGIYSGGTGYKPKIAVIDAGFVVHEDLFANFWVNENDIWNNGINEDSNGFIDDAYGWDAANYDNFPALDSDETDAIYGHGTFVAGFASSVTNIELGIASVAFNNALVMPIKVAKNNSDGIAEIPEGAIPLALDYAIVNGAEIVNMSLSAQDESSLGANAGRVMHEIVQKHMHRG